MKQIRIKKLSLTNWKAQTRVVEFERKNVISGRNGVGKTVAENAWYWLLSGSTDPHNGKNFELYDNKAEITPDTPIAEVEAVIVIDGYDYSIKRTAQAKFSRVRGESTITKDKADSYKLYIDLIETSVGDFNKFIEANICPVSMLPYLLNGEFFINLAEEDRDKARKVLSDISEEIPESDFEGDYKTLFEMMKRYSVDDLKKQNKKRMEPIKQRLEELPTIIELKQAELAAYSDESFATILAEIEEKKKEIEAIDAALLGSSETIQPLIDKRNKELAAISTLELELSTKKKEYTIAASDKPVKLQEELMKVKSDNERAVQINKNNKEANDRSKTQKAAFEKEVERFKSIREQLLKKKDEVKARKFDAEMCAYCDQLLPSDLLDKAKEKFDKQKKTELDAIIAEGKANNKKMEDAQASADKHAEIIENGYNVMPITDISDLEAQIQEALNEVIPFEKTPEYETLSAQIEDARSKVTVIPPQDNDALTSTKRTLMNDLELLNREYGKRDKMGEIEAEVNKLIEERKQQGVALGSLEGLEAQIIQYEKEKAQLVSDKVNHRLDFSQIEMSKILKSGEIAQTCTLRDINGVLYSTTNTSNRMLIAIDVQRLFCEHYECLMPIWIDEVQSIDENRRPDIPEYQIIFLERRDNELKVETI